jgi:hypothetical protein
VLECYVKLELAVNSDSKYEQEEKAIWDKYIDEIVNKEAEETKLFCSFRSKSNRRKRSSQGSNFATHNIN